MILWHANKNRGKGFCGKVSTIGCGKCLAAQATNFKKQIAAGTFGPQRCRDEDFKDFPGRGQG